MSLGSLILNIKALTLTVQKIIARFKFSKRGQTQRSRSQVKNNGTHGNVLSQEIFMLNIKALALTVQK